MEDVSKKGMCPSSAKKNFHGQKSSTTANTHVIHGGKDVPHGVARWWRDSTAQPGDGHPNAKPHATLTGFHDSLLGQPMRR